VSAPSASDPGGPAGAQRPAHPASETGGAAATETDDDELAALLSLATEAAKTGGALLLERVARGGERGVRAKSTPTDLVSEADFAAQRAIRELLGRRRPEDGFLGEEDEEHAGADGDAVERGSSGLRWVVDPLDGTVNYLFGIPQWCVSVAVQDAAGDTLAGAIFDPSREELFTATRGGDPQLNGATIAGSRRGELATAMVATGFYYDARVRAGQAVVLAALLPLVRDVRRLGSAALDLAWTAAGRFDAYFERGVKLWDVAAGALICQRAGLRVIDLAAVQTPAGAGADGCTMPPGLLVAPEGLAEDLLGHVG
jgi:myo-inositol-1(or 4)-monophosphatase